MICKKDPEALGHLYHFFLVGLASADLLKKCISKDEESKNVLTASR